jgi:hypothetical protein
MQIDTDVTGLFGITLALFVLLLLVPRIRAFPLPQRAAILFGALVLLSIPVFGVSLAGVVRGITGDLSLPTLLLLGLAVVRIVTGRALVEAEDRRLALQAIALMAVLFYPLALGFTAFDPYRLGYANLWFMAILFALALWSGLRYSTLFALCIAVAVAAWCVAWYESPNLWDYLLDPWLAIYALWVQFRYWFSRWRNMHA